MRFYFLIWVLITWGRGAVAAMALVLMMDFL